MTAPQPAQLAAPQAGGGSQLEHGSDLRIMLIRTGEEAEHLVELGSNGLARDVLALRQLEPAHRVGAHLVVASTPLVSAVRSGGDADGDGSPVEVVARTEARIGRGAGDADVEGLSLE